MLQTYQHKHLKEGSCRGGKSELVSGASNHSSKTMKKKTLPSSPISNIVKKKIVKD